MRVPHSTPPPVKAGAGTYGLSNISPGESIEIPKAMQTKVFDANYHRYGVHDDGSCFFHTICAALNLSNYRTKDHQARMRIGRQFRRVIQREISQQDWDQVWKNRKVNRRGSNIPSLTKIKEMLGNHKTWADVYMILYTMDKMNLNMLFFDASSDQVYCGVRGINSNKQDTVLVMWVNHAHFEPIFRKDQVDRGRDVFVYPTSDKDIQQLMKLYHTEMCPGHQDNVNALLG